MSVGGSAGVPGTSSSPSGGATAERRTTRLQWRRTIAFLIGLGLLLVSARAEVARPLVVIAFVLFAVLATVWVRGQYADSLDGEAWTPHPFWLAGLAAVAAVCVVVGGIGLLWSPALPGGTLLVVGAVGLYLVAGAVISSRRQQVAAALRDVTMPREEPRRTRVLVGVGVLIGVGVVAALGTSAVLALGGPAWTRGIAAGLALVALLTLPAGVSLASEAAIEILREHEKRIPRLLAMGSGAAVVVAALVAVVITESMWALVGIAALAGLVVALASSTQADIVVVLAVIALMGVTPQQARPPVYPADEDEVLVALGDSYMSGEGAAIYFEQTDEGGGNACRRAPTAWAALAGQEPQFGGLDFLACSGARTYDVRAHEGAVPMTPPEVAAVPAPPLAEQEHLTDGLDTQLAQYARHEGDYEPGLVVISIGGNDAGFATIGQMCVAPGDCSTERDTWLAGLDEVERELRRTYAEVRAAFAGVPVVVVPYPSPIAALDATGTSVQCDQISLDRAERTFVTQFLNALNGRIHAAANEAGFHYLAEMRNSLRDAHLQLCDPLNEERPGINFIGLRSVKGAPEQRFNPLNWSHNSLHPNERGHAAMLRTFQIWRAENPDLEVDAPNDPSAPTMEEASQEVAGAADCSVYADDGCRAEGTAWALGQIGRFGLTWGLGLGVVGTGAWAFAVGLFAWRRHRRALYSAAPDD
ncbi:lysophospholipase L1-like esterase/MFS family permease [Geodermatophilus bullaregiensis]|uniref:GDSL-type esterase/lipase family protein n=1 Tax=Geodermatophilus bullaregiensis TaxID=1564160 RepID=UPI00195BFC3A|nr:GDSL-type esterase/lipase family protein [Geodermatophilus bullaregiensis]MBM7807851.1 lysophospholipase L1-like esterase/MFS family permease [Geodermatophilus bullaregiensis]